MQNTEDLPAKLVWTNTRNLSGKKRSYDPITNHNILYLQVEEVYEVSRLSLLRRRVKIAAYIIEIADKIGQMYGQVPTQLATYSTLFGLVSSSFREK